MKIYFSKPLAAAVTAVLLAACAAQGVSPTQPGAASPSSPDASRRPATFYRLTIKNETAGRLSVQGEAEKCMHRTPGKFDIPPNQISQFTLETINDCVFDHSSFAIYFTRLDDPGKGQSIVSRWEKGNHSSGSWQVTVFRSSGLALHAIGRNALDVVLK